MIIHQKEKLSNLIAKFYIYKLYKIMKINFTSPISFNALEMYKANNLKFPNDLSCRTKDNDRTFYNVSVKENKTVGCYEVQFINNKTSELEAEQEMMIWPEIDYMFIDNMETYENCRGNGLGTCMHLANIIEMMENNIDKIELTAAPTAIPFHIKCGFKPDIKFDNQFSLENFRKIANDNTPELSKYSEDAKQLLKTRFEPSLKNKLGSKILLNYTKAAIKIMNTEEQKYIFPFGVDMTLTRKYVLKNKDFYNQLFNKYQIDYQITDSSD